MQIKGLKYDECCCGALFVLLCLYYFPLKIGKRCCFRYYLDPKVTRDNQKGQGNASLPSLYFLA